MASGYTRLFYRTVIRIIVWLLRTQKSLVVVVIVVL